MNTEELVYKVEFTTDELTVLADFLTQHVDPNEPSLLRDAAVRVVGKSLLAFMGLPDMNIPKMN